MHGVKLLKISTKVVLTMSLAWGCLMGGVAQAQYKRMIIIDKTASMQRMSDNQHCLNFFGPGTRCDCAIGFAKRQIDTWLNDGMTPLFIGVMSFGYPGGLSGKPEVLTDPKVAPLLQMQYHTFVDMSDPNAEAYVKGVVGGLCRSGNTQLADAVCLATDYMRDLSDTGGGGDLPYSHAQFLVLTDGHENRSRNVCSSETSTPLGVFPYTPGTWQALVWDYMMAPESATLGPVIEFDVGFFGPGPEGKLPGPVLTGSTTDSTREFELPESHDTGFVTDYELLQMLAAATGGTFTHYDDSSPYGPNESLSDMPTLSEWGMIVLTMVLLAGMTILIVRRRSLTM